MLRSDIIELLDRRLHRKRFMIMYKSLLIWSFRDLIVPFLPMDKPDLERLILCLAKDLMIKVIMRGKSGLFSLIKLMVKMLMRLEGKVLLLVYRIKVISKNEALFQELFPICLKKLKMQIWQ